MRKLKALLDSISADSTIYVGVVAVAINWTLIALISKYPQFFAVISSVVIALVFCGIWDSKVKSEKVLLPIYDIDQINDNLDDFMLMVFQNINHIVNIKYPHKKIDIYSDNPADDSFGLTLIKYRTAKDLHSVQDCGDKIDLECSKQIIQREIDRLLYTVGIAGCYSTGHPYINPLIYLVEMRDNGGEFEHHLAVVVDEYSNNWVTDYECRKKEANEQHININTICDDDV